MAAFAMAHPWLAFFLGLAAIWTLGDIIAMIVGHVAGSPKLTVQSSGVPRTWIVSAPGSWMPAS